MSIWILQVTVSEDGTKQIQGQVICRAMGNNNTPVPENDARYIAYVIQVKKIKYKKIKCLCSISIGCIY